MAMGKRDAGARGKNMLSQTVSELRSAVASAEAVRQRLGSDAAPVAADPLQQLRQWRLQSALRYVGKSLERGGK